MFSSASELWGFCMCAQLSDNSFMSLKKTQQILCIIEAHMQYRMRMHMQLQLHPEWSRNMDVFPRCYTWRGTHLCHKWQQASGQVQSQQPSALCPLLRGPAASTSSASPKQLFSPRVFGSGHLHKARAVWLHREQSSGSRGAHVHRRQAGSKLTHS